MNNQPRFAGMDRIGKGLIGILLINLAVFIFLNTSDLFVKFVDDYLILRADVFRPWQILTYLFIHFDLSHLFMNMLGLFFIGAHVEAQFGTRKFLIYFLICGVAGGLASYLFQSCSWFIPYLVSNPLRVIGASGALFGILYACYHFNPEGIILLFMAIPVKIKYLLLFFGVLEFVSLFQMESSHTAHFAHLGGLFAGIAYFRYQNRFVLWAHLIEMKKIQKKELQEERDSEHLEALLEKISQNGILSLSNAEKKFLKMQSSKRKSET